ncbi:MAG: O-antigen ligase family protein [Candidatus Nanopelagicales bacterium]
MSPETRGTTSRSLQILDNSVAAGVVVVVLVRVLAAMLADPLRDPGWPDVVVLVLAVAAGGWLAVRVPHSRGTIAATAAVVVFWLMPCLSAVVHGQPVPVASAAMAAVAATIVLAPNRSSLALRTAVVSGALVVLLSLIYGLVCLTGVSDAAFHVLPHYERAVAGIPALSGITLHPNTLGGIAAFVVAVGVALALRDLRFGTLVLPTLGVVALLWSQSRVGIASAVVAVIVLLVARRWPVWGVRSAGVLLLLPLVPVTVALWRIHGKAITSITNGRDLAWGPALRAFTESPPLGYGPTVLSKTYWRVQTPQWWEPLHAHNQVLQTLAESGVLGAAGLAALVLCAVLAVTRAGFAGALAAATLAFLCVQATVEVPLGLTYFPISYLLPTLCLTAFAYAGSEWARR